MPVPPADRLVPVDLADPQLIADPFSGWDRIREEAPLRRAVGALGGEVWLVTRQDDVRAVLADPRIVTDPARISGSVVDIRRQSLLRTGVPEHLLGYLVDTVIDHDGAGHTRLRKLVSRAFTVRRVDDLRPRIAQIAAGLLDRLTEPAERSSSEREDDVDLLDAFAYPLPIAVICELVGVPGAAWPDWRRWGGALVSMDPETLPAAMADMTAHCHELTAQRRIEPRDDLLTALTTAVDERGDRLSDREIVTMLLSLVLAGHETTAHLIANSAHALMTTDRDQLDVLRRDPSGWPAAIAELTRAHSPVHVARPRYAAADLDIGGVPVARGEALVAVLVAANRDPRVHAGPEHLDVTRYSGGRGDGHVGFGHGPHYCLGAALARLEGEIALRALFDRYPDIRFTGDAPQWIVLPGMRRLTTLPVRLRPAR